MNASSKYVQTVCKIWIENYGRSWLHKI